MLLAVSLVELALPPFARCLTRARKLRRTGHRVRLLAQPSLLLAMLGATSSVGRRRLLYPALVLSSFRPAAVLKGAALHGAGGARVRDLLVILQFAILVGLIFATTVICTHRPNSRCTRRCVSIPIRW